MPKHLVVCCDGTWNKPDQHENGKPSATNVTKLAVCLAGADAAGAKQMLFYDKGVGTVWYNWLVGGAFGAGLSKNIRDAYGFLVANYEPEDKLYFFGFSRGAYTARSLAGLVRNSGLLRREYAGKLDAAYELYRKRGDDSHPNALEAELFRKSFCHQPRIHFIGVWDTVGALGLPVPAPLGRLNQKWQFHDAKLSRSVDNAFHALAIDEKRKAFAPTMWEQQADAGAQVLEQVWFAGVHSNVGGGYGSTGLSDLALLWMIRKAEACGLVFDLAALGRLPEPIVVKPDALEMPRKSQTWFYKVLGGFRDYLRPIGKDDDGSPRASHESAAKSAADKLNAKDSPYQAKNLHEFLSANGPVYPGA